MNPRHLTRATGAMLAVLWELSAHAVSPTQEWRFNVSLDGRPIGYHRFALRANGSTSEVSSEARFNVRILFFDAYRYTHESQELWQGNCLGRIDARTDDNGATMNVRGAMVDGRFVLSGAGLDAELAPCVQTFAYWNPQILAATRLLNPQTGEYVPVRVEHVGSESLAIRGRPQPAERYRLTGQASDGKSLRFDLWYSPQREWLALESTTGAGRRLRYQLQ